MSEKRYVQHVSGQGEKWEILPKPAVDADDMQWTVKGTKCICYYLPKSEYAPCEPPEVWRDVTEQCSIFGDEITDCLGISHGRSPFYTDPILEWSKLNLAHRPHDWKLNYRLRKVQLEKRIDSSQHIHHGFTELPITEKAWAFVIERREQP